MTRAFIRVAHAACVVYDVCNPSSFESVETWINLTLSSVDNPSIPIAIIGNKCDMIRDVSTQQGIERTEELHKRGYNVAFFEASAKTAEGVVAILSHLMQGAQKICGSQKGLTLSTSTRDSTTCFQSSAPPRKQEVCPTVVHLSYIFYLRMRKQTHDFIYSTVFSSLCLSFSLHLFLSLFLSVPLIRSRILDLVIKSSDRSTRR